LEAKVFKDRQFPLIQLRPSAAVAEKILAEFLFIKFRAIEPARTKFALAIEPVRTKFALETFTEFSFPKFALGSIWLKFVCEESMWAIWLWLKFVWAIWLGKESMWAVGRRLWAEFLGLESIWLKFLC